MFERPTSYVSVHGLRYAKELAPSVAHLFARLFSVGTIDYGWHVLSTYKATNPTARHMWYSAVAPASIVRDLGVWIDSGLTMSTHISKIAAGCFTMLRQHAWRSEVIVALITHQPCRHPCAIAFGLL